MPEPTTGRAEGNAACSVDQRLEAPVRISESADLEPLHAPRADERKRAEPSATPAVAPAVALAAAPAPAPTEARVGLTYRERQVLQLVAAGLTSAQIGNRLTLGVRTVETHRAKVMRKLGVHTAAAMVWVA